MPRTGIFKLDNAVGRPPKTLMGTPTIKDPTLYGGVTRLYSWDSNACGTHGSLKFEDISRAYSVDSYIRQGVDKYVELSTKHGWYLDSETPNPVNYILSRFSLMGPMTDTPFPVLVDNLVLDFIKYGNAFWIKKRQKPPEGISILPDVGAGGNKLPVLAYFRADPRQMSPVWSKDGRQILGWELTPAGSPNTTFYKRSDIIHFPYNVQAGQIWGTPHLLPVLEDIREYRRCEEYVIKLLYKHLNPLMHHEIPDLTAGLGTGRSADLDLAQFSHQVIAPDGMIVTPPGHKISMIGAESRALRGEGYMKLLRERLYAGLGVNQIVMGEGENTTVGSADAMTATMHNKAKFFQRQLAAMLTEFVLYELLVEGGFDPINPKTTVKWTWNEMETEALIARENHATQLYTNNGITESEFRRFLGKKPMTDKEHQDTYLERVLIPKIEAEAKAKAAVAAASAQAGEDKTVATKNNPTNQHGDRGAPKIRAKS